MEEGQHFQQMVLEQLDIDRQKKKNESHPNAHTLYKRDLKKGAQI